MRDWLQCKNILLVRLYNLGDVIMSNPAFMQIRLNFPSAKLTLLTSSVASPIIPYLATIDETIIFDCPWMKNDISSAEQSQVEEFINLLKSRNFDACIIFNVYSQNILPAAMLCYMAKIPIRAGYCRENPYLLLTHWIPDPEPLKVIHHQITRELLLLKRLSFPYRKHKHPYLLHPSKKLNTKFDSIVNSNYIIVNFDVSEEKRRIPIKTAIHLLKELQKREEKVILIGRQYNSYFRELNKYISKEKTIDLISKTLIEDLLLLIKHASAVLTVNTSVSHIASAYNKPLLVLYANTNPQHLPWSSNCTYLLFPIEEKLKSKNEIIRYVNNNNYDSNAKELDTPIILKELDKLLN